MVIKLIKKNLPNFSWIYFKLINRGQLGDHITVKNFASDSGIITELSEPNGDVSDRLGITNILNDLSPMLERH